MGAGRSGGIRGTGVAVAGGTRSAQQMLDEAWCASLSRAQSYRAWTPILCGGDADRAVNATAGQRPVAIAPRSRCRELLDRQNPAGARA